MSNMSHAYLKVEWAGRFLRKHSAALWFFVGSLAIAGLAGVLGFRSALSAILASAIYYLLPAGIGLLMIQHGRGRKSAALSHGEIGLVSYFLGAMVLTIVYVARERMMPGLVARNIVDGLTGFIAICGLWRARRLLASVSNMETESRHGLLAFGVYGIGYIGCYFLQSTFPFTDLFQFTHILKASEEFVRFDRINPFTADSYVPAIPVLFGLSMKWSGAEPLAMVWVLSLTSFGFRWGLIYSLARRLPNMSSASTGLMAAISLPFFGVGVPTNGEIVACGACLVMALCVPAAEGSRLKYGLPLLLVLVGVLLSAYFSRFQPLPGYAAMLLLLLGSVIWSGWAPSAVLLLTVFVLVPLHRTSMVFLPMGATVMVWLSLASSRSVLAVRTARTFQIVSVAIVFLTIAKWRGFLQITDPGLWVTGLIDSVAGTRFTTDQDALMGVSSKVALFEVARAVGPLLLLFGLLSAWRRDPDPRFLPAQATASALIALLVIGLPFVHRSAFIIVLLLAAIVAQAFAETDSVNQRRQSIWFLIFVFVVMIAEYGLPIHSAVAAEYVARSAPLVLTAFACALLFTIAGRRLNVGGFALLTLALCSAVVVERQIVRASFLHYAYLDAPESRSKPVSHYMAQDLEVADWFAKDKRDIGLLSDPYTMAILRAQTGFNSLVSYSNLDTGRPAVTAALHAYLRSLTAVNPQSRVRVCPDLRHAEQLLSQGSSPEFNYVLKRYLNSESSGGSILEAFGYRDALLLGSAQSSTRLESHEPAQHQWLNLADPNLNPNLNMDPDADPNTDPTMDPNTDSPNLAPREIVMATVITGRTLRWASTTDAERQSYFAESDELPPNLRDRLIRDCGAQEVAGAVIIFTPFGLAGSVGQLPIHESSSH